MARKGIMSGLLDSEFTPVNSENSEPVDVAAPSSRRGAFGMMSRAADEMASKVEAAQKIEQQLLSGTQIIELDPNDLEGSFVADRLEDDDDTNFQELVKAISERGQDSPILVRPHPTSEGRYQIVFGHRRAKAAKVLGRTVRAAVKALTDQEHVVAQGQENTARADLSFIERALFAQKLQQSEFDNETIMSALAINKTILSKMVSVTGNIPLSIIHLIGAARGIGRDRWYDLSIVFKTENRADFENRAIQAAHNQPTSDARFNAIYDDMKKQTVKPKAEIKSAKWAADDGTVRAIIKPSAKAFSLDLKNKNAPAFGLWITENLNDLYSAFKKTQK